MFLLDTNVISEIRKASTGKAHHKVLTWAKGVSSINMYLSAITILELEKGILSIERRDQQQGQILRTWLEDQVLPAFSGRIIAVDTQVARRCASLHVPNPRPDRDALIAATALTHNMTLVTRNTGDFEASGANILNPWL